MHLLISHQVNEKMPVDYNRCSLKRVIEQKQSPIIMSFPRWGIYLFMGFISCSRPASPTVAPVSSTQAGEYTANALLNGATWFGSAFAQREHVVNGMPCTSNQFALGLSTDLPHAKSGNEPLGGVTACVTRCVSTQLLGFQRVPLVVGRHKLSDIQTCIDGNTRAAGEYNLLIGGDGIIDSYYPPGVTMQLGQRRVTIPGSDSSWIDVTRYDEKTNQVEGTFEVTLKNLTNEEVRFTKGSFKVTLLR